MFLGAFLIWAGLLLFLILGKEGNKIISISLVVYGIFVIGLHWYLNKTMGRRAYRKLKNFYDPLSIDINDTEILISIQDQIRTMLWSDINKAVISNNMVLLYVTDLIFYIFPGENFEAGSFEQFAILVRKKVQKIF